MWVRRVWRSDAPTWTPLRAVAVVVLVLVGAVGSRWFTTDAGVSLWSPSAAVVLVALVTLGPRAFPLVAVARIASTQVPGVSPLSLWQACLVWPLTLMPYLAVAVLIRRWFRVSVARTRLVDVAGTIGLGVVAAPVAASACWLMSRALVGELPGGPPARTAFEFAVGQSVAIVGLAPGIMHAVHVAGRGIRRPRAWQAVEGIAMAIACAATLVVVVETSVFGDTPTLYVAFVPFLWVAFRGGVGGVAACALLSSATLAVHLHVAEASSRQALVTQAFMVVLLGVNYAVGAQVGDRRRAEAAGKAADVRFRTAFDRSVVAMALVGLDRARRGRFLQVNDALRNLLGYTPEQLLAMSFADITHPDDYDPHQAVRTFDAGQTNYEVTKRYLHADGHELWCRVRAAVVNGSDGRPAYSISQLEDVTLERLRLHRLAWEASHDHLTGLHNRAGLSEVLRERAPDGWTTLLYLDLDRFKAVNDTLGHDVGDAVLVEVARRLQAVVRAGDTVARLGGDEFVVVAGMAYPDALAADSGGRDLADRIGVHFAQPIAAAGGLSVGVSVGVTVGEPGARAERLLQDADHEMLAAKGARPTARSGWPAASAP